MRRSPGIATPTAAVLSLALAGCASGGSPVPAQGTTASGSATVHAGSTATDAPPSTMPDRTPDGSSTAGTTTRSGLSTTASNRTGACTAALGDGCGAYHYAGIPNSNGYNTYVSNQAVGAQAGTTQTVYANDPGEWKLVAHAVPHGYRGVQTFPDVQQLFNNWCDSGWGDCANPANTPLDALSSLTVRYSETSPPLAKSINEFAVDVWSDGYDSDIMFWTDTRGRCDEGAFGDTVLGHAVLAGQAWTVHRYGEPGAEVIFVLDGAGGPGTCAQQPSGTVDVKAGLDWLGTHGLLPGRQALTQVNTGWEITSADDATFMVHEYSITAIPR